MTDYSKVEADPVWGPEIGRLYTEASPFITTLARHAYRSLADQVQRQFTSLVVGEGVRVEFTDDDPYDGSFEWMRSEIRSGHLRVWRTQPDQRHPLLTPYHNDRFRAVHDYYGHFLSGRGFDRHGEEAAWVRHSRMFHGLGRRAMTTETRGQNSALVWTNEGRMFPEQKAVLLPDWVSRVPERWSS